MRPSEKLTALFVDRVTTPGRYGDGLGLFLQVGPTGAKSWLFRYTRRGTERWKGLGPLHTVGLAKARALALDCRQQLLNGVDPLSVRDDEATKAEVRPRTEAKKETPLVTFAEAARAFHEAHEPEWRNPKHRAQVLQTMKTYAFPLIGKTPVGDIDNEHVVAVLKPIWKTKTETASRLRGRIEAVLSFAGVMKWRDIAAPNPARWSSNLEHLLPAPAKIHRAKNYAAMPVPQVPGFMVRLREREAVSAKALEFLILTTARTGSIIKARWDQIDLQNRVWIAPDDIMKAGKKQVYPLCGRALDVLRSLPRECDNPFIFIGGRGGCGLSNAAMDAMLHRHLGVPKSEATPHGFRSSFRDWAHSRTDAAFEVAEEQLAHNLGDETVLAYLRSPALVKRRALAQAWSRFLSSPESAHDERIISVARGVAA